MDRHSATEQAYKNGYRDGCTKILNYLIAFIECETFRKGCELTKVENKLKALLENLTREQL